MEKNYLIIEETPKTLLAFAALERASLVTRGVILSAGCMAVAVVTQFLCRSLPGPEADPYLLQRTASLLLSVLSLIYGILIFQIILSFLLLNSRKYLRASFSRLPLCIGMFEGHIIALNGEAVRHFTAGRSLREVKASCRKAAAALLSEYGRREDSFSRAVTLWVRRHRRYHGMAVFFLAVHEIEESQAENPEFITSEIPFAKFRLSPDKPR